MPTVRENVASATGIIHLHGLVIRTRCYTLPIGRPGHFPHCFRVPWVGEESETIAGIPHQHLLIKSARCYQLTIVWGPGHCSHRVSMTLIDERRVAKRFRWCLRRCC